MSKKICKEWCMEVPWGKIALISWGDPRNEPVLMVHGYMDTAATFVLLVEHLPDNYYYVSFDQPGHGLSSPFPPGPLLSHTHLVEVVRLVVEHLKWNTFIYLAHSVGFLIGIFFNCVHQGRIKKVINIDLAPSLAMCFMSTLHIRDFIKKYYIDNYENYDRFYNYRPKLTTYSQAVKEISKARKLSEEQAEVVLSRSLVLADNGLYQQSWDPRVKSFPGCLIPIETQFSIMTTNQPSTINIVATEYKFKGQRNEPFVQEFMAKIGDACPESIVMVEGGHDVHITSPDVVAGIITEFLTRDVKLNVGAKL